jgi:hypothetical protein
MTTGKKRTPVNQLNRWESRQFFGVRIENLTNALNETNRARFVAMTYEQKVAMIVRLIEEGSMI